MGSKPSTLPDRHKKALEALEAISFLEPYREGELYSPHFTSPGSKYILYASSVGCICCIDRGLEGIMLSGVTVYTFDTYFESLNLSQKKEMVYHLNVIREYWLPGVENVTFK